MWSDRGETLMNDLKIYYVYDGHRRSSVIPTWSMVFTILRGYIVLATEILYFDDENVLRDSFMNQ